jgi:O-antigen/teichoic acid export membrane protein
MNATKRIILNTGFLYGKMLTTMAISLFSTRLILNALGSEDFGIFNLVAGVIAMLSFLNGAMTVSTQRYMSYYLGANDSHLSNMVFRTSIILHLIIGLLVILLFEITGLFLFDGFLNISPQRISTAKIIYHFMVISTFFTINAVPYDAAINAHENMFFDALTGVFESCLKLGIAIWLIYSDYNHLLLYGLLMAVLTIIMRIIKSVYCSRKYVECKFRTKTKIEISLFKNMFSFAGWNLFGSIAGIGRIQGIAVILNIFFGTVINAAYGIANQVAGQLNSFSAMMLKAINPQIMKSEGANDHQRMLRLSMMASKFGFYLLAFFAIPCIYEMPMILNLWLKNVPENTAVFCDLMLIAMLASQLTVGLQSAVQATGKIKVYQSVVGSLLILNLPLAYLLLKIGMPAYSVLISFSAIEILACCFRLVFLKILAGLSIRQYVEEVFLRIIVPVLSVVIVGYLVVHNLKFPLRFLFTGFISTLIFSGTIYIFGLRKNEKDFVRRIFFKVVRIGNYSEI